MPLTEVEYQQLIVLLDKLLDQVGENESHPLVFLMEVIGVLIKGHEDIYVPELT